jgi:hypothetical protein
VEEELVLLLEDDALLVDEVEEVLVVLVVELVEEVVEVVVVIGELDQAKFARAKMTGPYAPQVALTS